MGRYGEMWGDMGRCVLSSARYGGDMGEIWGGVSSRVLDVGEIWGRYGEVCPLEC